MITEVKYFHEKTDGDYEIYNKLWADNIERFIFLQMDLSPKEQMNSIIRGLNDNTDILAVRFPLMNEINKNKIINNILLGYGFSYENGKVWYPKEIWIYHPM